MIRYLGKKLVHFIMTGPFFALSEQKEQIAEEKVVRNFLGGGVKEMKKTARKMFLKKNKSRNKDE